MLWTPPSNEQIKEELSLTREFIKEANDMLNPDTEELLALLETAVNQQQRKADNPGRSEPEEIISFTDTDARFGCKSKKKKFAGYKAHISLDEESSIVTSVRTIAGNRNEGAHQEVGKLLEDDAAKDITQEAVCADSLYDSYENRNQIHKQGMRAFIPSRTKAGLPKIPSESIASPHLQSPKSYGALLHTELKIIKREDKNNSIIQDFS